jgi:hypothetical protein
MLICVSCGRDIDTIGQDNCSCILGEPLCEDCAGSELFTDIPDDDKEVSE